MTTKICNKCNIEKPLEDFYKNLRGLDGHRSDCKECNSIDRANYRNTLNGSLRILFTTAKSHAKKDLIMEESKLVYLN